MPYAQKNARETNAYNQSNRAPKTFPGQSSSEVRQVLAGLHVGGRGEHRQEKRKAAQAHAMTLHLGKMKP